MQLTDQQQKMHEMQNTVISKCWEDESFKQELMTNPIAAIKNLTGNTLTVPKGKKFVVVDQTNDNYVYFNIPSMPDLDNLELTDEQLEQVAGGITPGFVIFSYFAAGVGIGRAIGDLLSDDP